MNQRRLYYFISFLGLISLLVFQPAMSVAAQDGVTTKYPRVGATNEGVLENSAVLVPAAELNAVNLILDPGFELYNPNPYWEDYSQEFGITMCTVADCSTGMGTGPKSGTVWVWFGGSEVGDVGYVYQGVTIPGGKATFSFWVEQITCGTGGASNYVKLMVDSTEVWRTDGTDPACGVLGYRQIKLDLSPFANGSAHVIRFDSTTIGQGNFFLDDLSLTVEPYKLFLPVILR